MPLMPSLHSAFFRCSFASFSSVSHANLLSSRFVHLAPPIQVAGVFEGDEIVLVNGEPAASAGPQGDKLQTSADLVTSFPKNGSGTGI